VHYGFLTGVTIIQKEQKMRRRVQTTTLVLLTLGLFACATQAPVTTRIVYSDDGVSEVTAPDYWYTRADFGQSASLRAADGSRENYLLVNSYFPHEIDPTSLEKFAEKVSVTLRDNLENGKMSDPRRFTVNDRPAVEYEITGASDGTRLVYLSTVVEGRHAKHHLVAWTLEERYGSNRDALRGVVASFRESAARRAARPRTNLTFKWPKQITSNGSFHSKQSKRGESFELRGQFVSTVKPLDNGQLLVSSRVTGQKMTSTVKDKSKTDYLQKVLKEALSDQPDYVITDDGSFVRIENLDAYRQRIEGAILKGLPDGPQAGREKARQLVKTLLSEQALAASIQAEWNNIVSNWAGGSYAQGQNYEYVVQYQAPALGDQVFPMTVTQQLTGHVACQKGAKEKSCVRMLQTSRVSDPDFTKATDRFVRKTVGGGVVVNNVEVVKTVELITDPKTMLPHNVHAIETKTVMVAADGKSETTKEVQETSSVYQY
jgi:hypothetical protein